jgi:hypothetical protein
VIFALRPALAQDTERAESRRRAVYCRHSSRTQRRGWSRGCSPNLTCPGCLPRCWAEPASAQGVSAMDLVVATTADNLPTDFYAAAVAACVVIVFAKFATQNHPGKPKARMSFVGWVTGAGGHAVCIGFAWLGLLLALLMLSENWLSGEEWIRWVVVRPLLKPGLRPTSPANSEAVVAWCSLASWRTSHSFRVTRCSGLNGSGREPIRPLSCRNSDVW